MRLKHIILSAFLLMSMAATAQKTSHVIVGGSVFGGGKSANVGGKSTVLIDQAGAVIEKDVYGGGAFANVDTINKNLQNTVTLVQGTVNQDIYGGGLGDASHAAKVYGPVQVNINGGQARNVFGCNNENGAPQTTVQVYITNGTVNQNVFGGGNLAEAAVSPVVTVTGGTVTRNVFGGGNEAGVAATTVNINGGTVCTGNHLYGIYGGCNTSGTVTGDIAVNINGGTLGVYNSDTLRGIYGGGLGASTQTQGNVTVTIGDLAGTKTPTIVGDIYGGSALGQVNGSGNITKVDFLNGTLHGNIYGGGLGEEGETNVTKGQVNGEVQVNIGADAQADDKCHISLIGCSVFGCNNTNGSPKKDVTVNVYKTAHNDSNAASYTENDGTHGEPTFAIAQVFGGGNHAHYQPAAVGENEDPHITTVNIFNCDNTIEDVYGGGNAANVGTSTVESATNVVIYGGRIEWVFGGGNGYSETNNHNDPTAANYNPGANIYGDTKVTFHAGNLHYIFGGSNQYGIVSGDKTVDILADGTCTVKHIAELYGGSNMAPTEGDVNLTMGCPEHTCEIGALFGGSRNANITGDVTLTVKGGNYDYVYGGNNIGGTINGNVTLNLCGGTINNAAFGGNNAGGKIKGYITVNLLDTVSSCPLQVDTIYGGGCDAAYAPDSLAGKKIVSPVVNLLHGTVGHTAEGCVFGGGKGSTATVTAHPKVIIGDTITTGTNASTHIAYQAKVLGSVFGGGNAAEVDGIDSVLMLKGNNVVTNLFGGGNEALADSTVVRMTAGTVDTIFGGGNKAGLSGNALVTLVNGTVTKGVFGGCNTSGTVADSTKVIVAGGTVGTANTTIGAIYGGGYGVDTKVKGDVIVTIDGGTINNDVYGGSAKGLVNYNDAGNAATAGSTTEVTLNAGTINGSLYGGGHGISNADAHVWGPVQVTVNGGTVTGAVYGCNNVNGAPQSTVKVDIYRTDTPASGYALGNVFGGGNQAAFGGTPEVTIHNCDNSIGYVYGGGNKASVGNTLVKVYGGNTIGYVFAGGNGDGMGTNTMVSGNAAASIYGGTIAHVFGGNNHAGTIDGTTAVHVNKETETGHESCAMKVGEVYGGGNEADGNAGTIDIDCTGTWTDAHNNHNSTTNRIGYELEGIGTVYGGANNANINNSITVTINSGIVENVFGGNNLDGTISGSIQVEIDSTSGSNTCSWYVGNVYGGGNQATYGTGGDSPVVNIKRGLVSGDVFGGGLGLSGNPNKGKVIGNPQVTVNSDKARVNGSVYGGGSLALTQGNPLVTLTEGALTKVFGGGKAASVTGAPTVAITGGTVSTGVYGGCNTSGTVSGNIAVNVKGGTLGSDANLHLTPPVTVDVFGGGYGEDTKTSGNVVVNIGEPNPTSHSDFPKIYGDVYGGSALGEVNDNASDQTTVNIYNGTLFTKEGTSANGFPIYYGGNVYGGGLGYYVDTHHDSIPAKVNGLVKVNIGSGDMNSTDPRFTENTYGEAIIQGNVYGCNNTYGSPQQNVTVNIYKTYMPADTAYTATYLENDGIHGNPKYVLANVFGGGNEANFQVTGKTATVNIYGCENTIRRTFGGSNAAASNSVSTMIQGGRIHEAFGGGNGEVSPANVDGNVLLAIHGGKVDQSFGGSNQQGTISGTSDVTIDSEGGCGESVIEEFYCGGNFADYYGDIDATIDCAAGLHIQNLYGGCKQADVLPDGNHIGNVHLVVNGGTYENIFGGSQGRLEGTDPEHPTEESADISGHILLEIHGGTVTNAIFGGSHILGSVAGTITVNIEDKNTGCPLDLSAADVYGGGYQADYVTPTVAGHDEAHDYPQVNIKNATVKNVFGGGLEAKVKGNPQIRIKKGSKVLGNVYGGGNLGELEGNPKVIVNGKDETENPHVFPSITLPNSTNDK